MTIIQNASGLFESTVDGHHYEFAKWGANLSLETLMDLSSVLGKPIGALVAATGGKSDTQVTASMLDDVVGSLASEMRNNRAAVLSTLHKLCANEVMCDHKQVSNFDLHYKGRIGHIFRVARANLEVQYGDFLSELGISKKQVDALKGLGRKTSLTDLPSAPTPA